MSLYKKILTLSLPVLMAFGMLAVVPQVAYASPASKVTDGIKAAGGDEACKGDGCSANTIIKKVTNVLLFIIGAISVIMIIFGGIKYTTSNGDSSQVTSAKNTIMYAVIGLIVALLAYAIVDFVIKQFTK